MKRQSLNRILIFILILFFQVQTQASESLLKKGVKGIWLNPNETEEPGFSWNAQWIWLDEALNKDLLLARKTFQLDEIPKTAKIRITASSQYQLFINGAYINRGPARSAPHHQSYDILEISERLQRGKNLIAVRVHHQQGKKSHQFEGRAGLLVQLDVGDKNMISDNSWKVSEDLAWDSSAPKISRFQQVVNDRVDFRNYIKHWNQLDFDDSEWENAFSLLRKTGWPSPQKNAAPQTLTPPWTSLVPRDIPYLTEIEIPAKKLIEAVQISGLTNEILLTKKIAISNENLIPPSSANKSWFLLYDFGEVINGFPKIDIKGKAGTEIQIVSAPFIVEDKFSYKTVDSEFRDKIILSGKRDSWEATYFKPTRFLGLIIENDDKVSLSSLGIRQIKYPFEPKGKMSAADAPWVEAYFNATAKTINVCTTDALTDNYRERRQYAQTGYYGALGNYFIYGDFHLQRRYLIQTAHEQFANGIMPAYAPAAAEDYMIILDSNCLWLRSLKNYLLYSGDYKTTKELLPAAKKLMTLLHSFTDSMGLINNPPFAYWLDHALNDRRGANLNLNGHYLGALNDFGQVLSWLNDPKAKHYFQRAIKLSNSIRKHFWNNEKQLYVDALINGKQSEMFSEHANAMVLALNIASPEQSKLIAKELLKKDPHNFIKRASGITMVTPAMSYFLHKGLCCAGYINESMEMFRNRFKHMLNPNTNKTLWEEWWLDAIGRTGKLQKGRTRSDAQTESAFPPALFAEFLLGMEVTKPGMEEIEIRHLNTKIKNIKGEIPTPKGTLEIEWKINEENGKLLLTIPNGISVKVNPAGLEYLGNKITFNGKIVQGKSPLSFINLQSGKYQIDF